MEKQKSRNNLIISLLIFMIASFLFILIRIGNKFDFFVFLGKNRAIILNIVNQALFIGGLPILLYMLFSKKSLKQTTRDFKFTKISGKLVLNSFLLGLICFCFVLLISLWWNLIISVTGYEKPLFFISSISTKQAVNNFLIGIITTCLLPGICEEILLRGCVLGGVEKLGRKKAILFCGLLFAFLHLNINQFAHTFALGCFLAMLTMMVKSIWPAIIIHFTSNFCSVLSTFIASLNLFDGRFNQFFSNLFSGFTSNLLSLLINTLLSSIILFFLFFPVFSKFISFSRSKNLHDKFQNLLKNTKIKEGEGFEITEENAQTIIDMKKLVENEISDQIKNIKRPFDFILPPTNADKYKPTKNEKIVIISAFLLIGGAMLVGFLGGLL